MQSVSQYNSDCFSFTEFTHEIKIEIFKFLDKADLGHLTCLSRAWSSDEMSNILWKQFCATRLPKKYQDLPLPLLKERFKAYHQNMKNRVDDILSNDEKFKFSIFTNRPQGFSKEFKQELLNLPSLEEKNSAIDRGLNAFLFYIASFPFPHLAAEADKVLQLGADPNYTKLHSSCQTIHITVLHKACSSRNLHVARKLIEYGADVHAKDQNGRTPLDLLSPGLLDPLRPLTSDVIEAFKRDAAYLGRQH
jgi:hypothetical protein